MNIEDKCAITYGDLYALVFWSTVLIAAIVVFVNMDTYKTAEKIVAYFDKTAMQYLHMRGQAFSRAEKE